MRTNTHPFAPGTVQRSRLIHLLVLVSLAVAWCAPAVPGVEGEDVTELQVLIVVTNHGTLGPSDADAKPTGFWLAEVAHPWAEFRDAGLAVDFASPDGGFVPMDPRSFDLEDAVNRRLWENLGAIEALYNSHALAAVDPTDYDAIFFAGGHGTMWDFPANEVVQQAVRRVWDDGGIVGAVCHGPAALVGVELEGGKQLVAGKRLTAFTVAEERAVDLVDAVPFLLTERLEELGATVVTAETFAEQVVADGRLVTGQNPASAGPTAARIVSLLQKR